MCDWSERSASKSSTAASHLKRSLERPGGRGRKRVTDHKTLQTESNEGVVGSVDNLDRDNHRGLSCSEDMIGIQRG